MKKLLVFLAVLIGVGIGVLGAPTFFGAGPDSPTDADTGQAATAPSSSGALTGPDSGGEGAPTQVRVRTIAAEAMSEELVLQGRTMAQRTVRLRAEIAGTVETILVSHGEFVEQGAPIITLSADDREARSVEAEALVRQREAEYQVVQTLNQRGLRSSTEVDQARAALEAARASLSAASLSLERMVIGAPFSGVLNERSAELGAFLDRGEEIGVLVDLDPMRVRGQVAERNLGQVTVGAVAEVRLVDGRTVEGGVSYIGSVADQQTRTFPIEVEIANSDLSIIENLTAEIRLPLREVMAHRIEASLLSLSDDGVLGVKSIDGDDVVSFHEVEILGDSDGAIWVGGLPETLTVITVGQDFVLAGQRVLAVSEADVAAGSTL